MHTSSTRAYSLEVLLRYLARLQEQDPLSAIEQLVDECNLDVAHIQRVLRDVQVIPPVCSCCRHATERLIVQASTFEPRQPAALR
jgi:hypothetical protein